MRIPDVLVGLCAAATVATIVLPGTTAQAAQGLEPVSEITSDVRVTDGPTVVVTPAGTSITLWIERNGRVMTASRASSASSWSVPSAISRNGFYATIVTQGFNRATVAWQSLGARHASIHVRSVDEQGVWGPAERVTRWVRHGGVTVALTIGANARGDMLAAWTRGHRVRASYREAGGEWGSEFVFPDEDAYSLEAVANVNPAGEADLVFPADMAGPRSMLRAYHRDGTGAWSGQTLAKYATGLHFLGSTADVAINRAGDMVAAWMHRPALGEPWRISARSLSAAQVLEPIHSVAVHARNPAVAIDGSGASGLAFLARRGSETVTKFDYRSAAGVWSDPVEVSSVTTDDLPFQQLGLETNASGDFVVHTQGVHATAHSTAIRDHRLARCSAERCAAPKVLLVPRGYRAMTYAVRSHGGVDTAWASGCATEECIPTGIRAQRLSMAS